MLSRTSEPSKGAKSRLRNAGSELALDMISSTNCKSPNFCAARVLKQQQDRQDQVLPSGFFKVSVGFVGLVVRCVVLVSYLFRGLTLLAEPQSPSGAVVH